MSQTKGIWYLCWEEKYYRLQHVCNSISIAFRSLDQILDQGKILSIHHFEV